MAKYFFFLALWSVSAFAQSNAAALTNETIIRLIASGVPAETVINTIRSASSVSFGFLPGDLELLQRYRVPDDVVKAMSARSYGKPIPQTSAPAAQGSSPPSARADAVAPTPDSLSNDSLVKLAKAGMGDDTIIGIVNSQPGRYSLSTESLISLKQAGISDRVVAAMVIRNSKTAPAIAGSSVQQISTVTPQPGLTQVANSTVEQTPNPVQGARIFVTDSNSWEISGGFSAASNRNGGAASGRFAGGARPQTVEIIKTFNERCSGVTVTMDRSQAQFIVLFDHEGGKGYVRKDNKIAVFKSSGDLLFSDSTRSLGNAVKDACEAIFR
jgi:hypothetical protein